MALGGRDPTDAQKAAAAEEVHSANSALTDASTQRDAQWTAFETVFEDWSDAYDAAVDGIQKAMDTAGNNDGFWEFVDDALQVISIVLMVLSVIALIIGAPLTGILGLVILGLTLLSLGLTLLKFAYGRATLSDVLWSAVSLVPFGIGKVLSRGAPLLTQVVGGGRGIATAAIRAGLPRLSLMRPTTWLTPLRSMVAPVKSWLALPRPSMMVNPFRPIANGGTEPVQIVKFLSTLENSPWGRLPSMQAFVGATRANLPGVGGKILNVVVWAGSTTSDVLGLADKQPDIPGASDIWVKPTPVVTVA